MHDWIRTLASRRFPAGPRSQGRQDAILAEIFGHVRTVNDPPFGVEFGFNSDWLDGGTGSNVATLVIEQGWRALLLDRSHENPAINLHREFLNAANVADVLVRRGVPAEPDYISIDVDSTDLWLFRALLARLRASVFSVEYNAHFPLGLAVTCDDQPDAPYAGDRAYGASLRALFAVAREFGYSLVAVDAPFDAFFIRDDLIDDGSGCIAPSLSCWRASTLRRIHRPVQDAARLARFIDYHTWVATAGDTEAARRQATAACRPYLTAGRLGMLARRAWDRMAGRVGMA
jgi:hypothetical protein